MDDNSLGQVHYDSETPRLNGRVKLGLGIESYIFNHCGYIIAVIHLTLSGIHYSTW